MYWIWRLFFICMQKEPKYSWNVVILSGNKQEEDVETRLGAEDSRFQRILWAVNLLTDVMLFVGKLHSAHLFQIDSELLLSNATPATQGSNSGTRRWKRKEEESWRRCQCCCGLRGVEKEKKKSMRQKRRHGMMKRPSWRRRSRLWKNLINRANKEFKAAISRGPRTDDNKVKDTCFKQVGECETRIADLSEQLSSIQRKLAKLCEKKPKGKE